MKDPQLHPAQAVRATKFAVRKATGADATAISALLKEAFAEFESLYTPEAFAATVLSDSGVLARLKEGPVWVAEIGPSIIGTVGAMRGSDSVMVRGTSARGLGASKCLLDHVECFAIQEGARFLELYTTAFLDRAIRLYQAAGFTFTGEKANPHGPELLGMTKALTP